MAPEGRPPEIGDLVPYTDAWHTAHVGMLIGNLQTLEYAARLVIARAASRGDPDTGFPQLPAMREGDWVDVRNPLVNYDQLRDVLEKCNEFLPPERKFDVTPLVDLRDQLAHGRVLGLTPRFPLTLFKFGKPTNGRVQVTARIEMTEEWFRQQRTLVTDTINRSFVPPLEMRELP